MLEEMIKVLTLDSKINYSAYYNSDKYDAEGNPKSDPLVATHNIDGKKRKVTDTDTTNVSSPQDLFINRNLPMIIPPIDLWIGTMHAHQMIDLKVIVTDVTRSGACVFRNTADVN